MFNDNFYHQTLRKYHAFFASLFTRVFLDRSNDAGQLARIQVPLHFAAREHALTRVQDDPKIDKKEAIFLPAMAYELVDMQYNGNRKTPTMNSIARKMSSDPNKFFHQLVPVPYDLHFRLYILVKNYDDGCKIVEQITPYFTPDFSATLEMIPEMELNIDTQVTLTSVAIENNIPAEYREKVKLMWVMDFVLEGFIWGPVKKQPVIKFANVQFHGVGGDGSLGSPFLRTETTPGMTANGDPTIDPSESVPYLTIFVDDNWDYAFQANTVL